MKLIKTKSYSGYYLEDIEKTMDKKTWKLFCEWMNGQTGAIHKGKLLVYKWDLERFLQGKEPLD